MDALSMRWRDTVFAHWPVEPSVVESRLPADLTVATYDGQAWLSVVTFQMGGVRPRGLPASLSFPEANLRTYVEPAAGGERGVYFFTLDAADMLAVALARVTTRLPYHRATMSLRAHDGSVTVQSYRPGIDGNPASHIDVTCRPDGDPRTAEPGSLDEFLAENYRFYTDEWPILVGKIAHEPWPLETATLEVRANTLFEACGFEHPAGKPLVHYAKEVGVTAELPWPLR
ncbi:YqjF family protein [Haloferax namakaokahaiae]|uniref:YqjF family protein n=1 Tax=Haloferax namakaokahaiae TaxID=1748331 RepID=A0ABD5ZG33_9EURY